MHLMFDVINDGLFGNKLDRNIKKVVLRAESCPTGPLKYRGMKSALAGFAAGIVRGQPRELVIVKQPYPMSFYITICSLIHEMIHMFDFHYGPMGEQLKKFGAVASYNFNYPFINPETGEAMTPRSDNEFQICNVGNAAASGFKTVEQLPTEILQKIKNPSQDRRPRQYQMPGIEIRPVKDPQTGELLPCTVPANRKFTMDQLEGFYDVHGDFFLRIADTINRYGFGITDIFDKSTPKQMTRTYESANGEIPTNPAQTLLMFFKDDEHKACDYKDEDNWFVEIT